MIYPEGIKVDGNKITIALTEDYPHPQFRFCLEIFGIVPRKDVDPKTNKIAAEKVATSGYYELKESGENSLLFQKRPDIGKIQGKDYPAQIRFLYRDPQTAFRDATLKSDDTVIFSSESLLSREQLRQVEAGFKVGFTPAAWFTILQINPDVIPFEDASCRLLFAEAFRKNYQKITGNESEASVFTLMVEGYKSHDQLLETSKISPEQSIACASKLARAKVPFSFDSSTPESFVAAIRATAEELGVELLVSSQSTDRKQEVTKFLAGKSTFMYNRTGFWAMDPTGDIQMLFTPNLHLGLKHFWQDQRLQGLLQKVASNGVVDAEVVDAANAYLFSSAKLNVYSHIRRFYASQNKDLVHRLPIGITNPSPWHLFGSRQ